MHVVFDGNTINIMDRFVCDLCEDRGSSNEAQRRFQAGAAAERRRYYVSQKVEEISKGKMLEACFVLSCVSGLGTRELTKGEDKGIRQQLGSHNTYVRTMRESKIINRNEETPDLRCNSLIN